MRHKPKQQQELLGTTKNSRCSARDENKGGLVATWGLLLLNSCSLLVAKLVAAANHRLIIQCLGGQRHLLLTQPVLTLPLLLPLLLLYYRWCLSAPRGPAGALSLSPACAVNCLVYDV